MVRSTPPMMVVLPLLFAAKDTLAKAPSLVVGMMLLDTLSLVMWIRGAAVAQLESNTTNRVTTIDRQRQSLTEDR